MCGCILQYEAHPTLEYREHSWKATVCGRMLLKITLTWTGEKMTVEKCFVKKHSYYSVEYLGQLIPLVGFLLPRENYSVGRRSPRVPRGPEGQTLVSLSLIPADRFYWVSFWTKFFSFQLLWLEKDSIVTSKKIKFVLFQAFWRSFWDKV